MGYIETVRTAVVAALCALASLLVACSSSNPSTSNPAAAQACKDIAAAVATASVRCGGEYQANYDEFVNQAANGDCANITSVRDEAALRATCIPSMQTISCSDLTAGALDPTCDNQLSM
jgi:hypothetical protein